MTCSPPPFIHWPNGMEAPGQISDRDSADFPLHWSHREQTYLPEVTLRMQVPAPRTALPNGMGTIGLRLARTSTARLIPSLLWGLICTREVISPRPEEFQ